MSDCARCSRAFTRAVAERARCHVCGACTECCECSDGPDADDFNHDTGGFDRDELGRDPERDA